MEEIRHTLRCMRPRHWLYFTFSSMPSLVLVWTHAHPLYAVAILAFGLTVGVLGATYMPKILGE